MVVLLAHSHLSNNFPLEAFILIQCLINPFHICDLLFIKIIIDFTVQVIINPN